MAAKVLNSFIADDVRVEESGKINVFGMYFDVNTRTRQPAEMSKAVLFVMLTDVEEGDHEVSVTVADHTAKKAISQVVGHLKDADPEQIHQMIVEMVGFCFPSSGLYTLSIILDDKILSDSQISVEYPEAPASVNLSES
jgi:hypothetical protein